MAKPRLRPTVENHQLELDGFQELEERLRAAADIDFEPLMFQWERILQDDNREGALLGLDGEGRPLAEVTYRPIAVEDVDYRILPNDNLTESHYQTLGGAPLAPRGLASRIVKNHRTSHARLSDDRWAVVGAWEGIMDPEGHPFLGDHFEGRKGLKRRDLRGVRPAAVASATAKADDFIRRAMDAAFGD